VLVDLGSAVLATQTALELLGVDAAARVRLSGGPLVEGAVVAAVQASVGDDLGAVLAAAEEAASLPKIPE
jgi:dihydroxyacetone kinase DhaKLM complex PTS-EIIA-like component DhaM